MPAGKNATFNTYNSAGRDHVLALWCCRYWYDLSSHDEYAPAFSGGDSRGDAAIVVVMVENRSSSSSRLAVALVVVVVAAGAVAEGVVVSNKCSSSCAAATPWASEGEARPAHVQKVMTGLLCANIFASLCAIDIATFCSLLLFLMLFCPYTYVCM